MDIKKVIIEKFLASEIQSQVASGIETYTRTQAAAIGSRPEDDGWRRLTGPNATREIVTTSQERMQEVAVWLAENNPLAKWIIDVLADFMVADGLPFEADSESVSEALEDFYYDPLNQLDVYIKKHEREKRIFGELCLPAWTAKNTGSLRLGYIDPVQIDLVVTDPENVKMAIGVILKSANAEPGRRLKIILPEDAEEIMSAEARRMRDTFGDGECFYAAINNLTNSPRGRSELLATADWIDAYEQFLFDCADRWPLLNSFIWDITVKGGDTAACKTQADALTKKAGSAFAHNENVTLAAITPDLKTQEIDTGARVLRNHILGSHGYPEVWFGGGGDANRASSVEMGTPAFKMLSSKQREFKAFWEIVFQTVIDRRRAAGTLSCSDDDATEWSIVLPDLTSKDLTKNSAALQQISASLAAAISQKIIDTGSARKVFLFITASLGIEIDEADVEEKLEEELEKQEAQDYRTNPKPNISVGEGQEFEEKQPGQGADQSVAMMKEALSFALRAAEQKDPHEALRIVGPVLSDLSDALRAASMRDTPAPVVNTTVEAPVVNVTPAPITVEAPVVNVTPAPITVEAPSVTFHPPAVHVTPAPVTVEAPQVYVTPAPIDITIPVDIRAAEKKGFTVRRNADGSLTTEPKEE